MSRRLSKLSVLAAESPLQVAFLSLQTRGGLEPKKGWSAENCVAFHTFQRSRPQSSGGAVGGRIDLWLLHHFEAPPCWSSPGWPATVHRWAGPHRANRIYSRVTPLSELAARFAAIGINMSKATNPALREFGRGWIMGCKPLLGVLFADLLPEKYGFWMYGDLDGLFGATRDLFTWSRLHDHDYVTGYSQEGRFDAAGYVRPGCQRDVHASGPLQIYRNSEAMRSFGRLSARVFRQDLELGWGYGLEEYFGQHKYHSSALLAAAANGSLSSIRREDIRRKDIRRILFRSEWLPRPPFRSPTASPACQAGQGGLGSAADVLILNAWYPKNSPGGATRWLRDLVHRKQPLPTPIAIVWSAAQGLVVKQLTTSGEIDRFNQRLTVAGEESPLGAATSTVHFLHFLWLKRSIVSAGFQRCLRKIAQQLPHLHRIALLIRNATIKCDVRTTALRVR